jgi:hypothetical protein
MVKFIFQRYVNGNNTCKYINNTHTRSVSFVDSYGVMNIHISFNPQKCYCLESQNMAEEMCNIGGHIQNVIFLGYLTSITRHL